MDDFTGSQYRIFFGPLHELTQGIEKSVVQVAELAEKVLCSGMACTSEAALLAAEINTLEERRYGLCFSQGQLPAYVDFHEGRNGDWTV